MKKCAIFKPTPQLKELLILTQIMNNKNITQREIATEVDCSVAMVNEYLEKFETEGFIKRIYHTKKIVEYLITKEGKNRIKVLNINYMENSMNVFKLVKQEMTIFLENMQKKYKNIILYGAGEVGTTLLFVIEVSKSLDLNIVAIIDDDIEKQGKTLGNKKIISFNDLDKYDYDAIFISTYDHDEKIYNKLKENNIDDKKIVQFFE